jgi:hypothetical protein
MEKQEKVVGSDEVRALSRNEMSEIVGGATYTAVKSMSNLRALLSARALYGVDYLANLGRDVA